MSEEKLPAELFVHKTSVEKKPVQFKASRTLKEIDCVNQRVRVGVYKLVKEVEVIAEATIVAEVG